MTGDIIIAIVFIIIVILVLYHMGFTFGCFLDMMHLAWNSEGFNSGMNGELRYGGVNVAFQDIQNTLPTVNADFKESKLMIPNSYSYADKATSIDGPDTKLPDQHNTHISDYHMAKKRLI